MHTQEKSKKINTGKNPMTNLRYAYTAFTVNIQNPAGRDSASVLNPDLDQDPQ